MYLFVYFLRLGIYVAESAQDQILVSHNGGDVYYRAHWSFISHALVAHIQCATGGVSVSTYL